MVKEQCSTRRKMVVVLSAMLAMIANPLAASAEAGASPTTIAAEKISAEYLAGQRMRARSLLASLVRRKNGTPSFTHWYSEADVFATAEQAPAARLPFPGLPIGAGAASGMRLQHFADAAVITFVHYDQQAYRHIRRHQLYQETQLQEIAASGGKDPDFPGMTRVPPLPAGAQVLMSAWWPLAADAQTPLPVWDPQRSLRGGSNDYPSWTRVVAVGSQIRVPSALTFAGRAFPTAKRVSPNRFFHLIVDASLAARLEADPGSHKAALLVLGRPLKVGDTLVLVAFHLLTTDKGSGIWATWWWHDRPTEGRFGSDRPERISGPWKNYLMDVTTDAVLPREADDSPRICFNPWFEARLPGGSEGNGVQSNCVNCHSRASYPKTAFLPIRRGAADRLDDPAYAPGRVRTGFLWSLANPSQAAE